jgi:hypothetical protein
MLGRYHRRNVLRRRFTGSKAMIAAAIVAG